jgi:hypothetical protein
MSLILFGCIQEDVTPQDDFSQDVITQTEVDKPIGLTRFVFDNEIDKNRLSREHLLVSRDIQSLGKCVNSIEEYEPTYQYRDERKNNTLDLRNDNLVKYRVYCEEASFGEYVLVVQNEMPSEDLMLALGIRHQSNYIPQDIESFWNEFFYYYLVTRKDIHTWSSLRNNGHPNVNSQGVDFLVNLYLQDDISLLQKVSCTTKRNKTFTSIVPGTPPLITIEFNCSAGYYSSDFTGLTSNLSLNFEYSHLPTLLEVTVSNSNYCSPSRENCQRLIGPSRRVDKFQIENNELNFDILSFYNKKGAFQNNNKHIIYSYLNAYYRSINQPALNYWDLFWQERELYLSTPIISSYRYLSESEIVYRTNTKNLITNNKDLLINKNGLITINLGGEDGNFNDLNEYILFNFEDGSLIYRNIDENLYFVSTTECLNCTIYYSDTNLDQTGMEVLNRDYLIPFLDIIRTMINRVESSTKINFPLDINQFNGKWMENFDSKYCGQLTSTSQFCN